MNSSRNAATLIFLCSAIYNHTNVYKFINVQDISLRHLSFIKIQKFEKLLYLENIKKYKMEKNIFQSCFATCGIIIFYIQLKKYFLKYTFY